MKKEKSKKPSEADASEKKAYHFGQITVIKFEELDLPQFELSVFASADIQDGGMGGIGPNDSRPPAMT
jgi:hypothetical protein